MKINSKTKQNGSSRADAVSASIISEHEVLDKQDKRILRLNKQRPDRMDEMVDYNAHEADTIDADDDEELEDEEAFNDSDEENFGVHFAEVCAANSKSSKSTSKKMGFDEDDDELLDEGFPIKSREVNKRKRNSTDVKSDSESPEENDEDWGSDDGEMMDISDLLGTGPSKAIPVNPSHKLSMSDPHDPSNLLLAKHADDSDIDNESIFDSDEDKDAANKTDLSEFVSNLDKKKRKVALKESTEAYAESEFHLSTRRQDPAALVAANAKLDLSDLVASISTESTFTNLRKQISDFAPASGPTLPAKTGSLRAVGTESAPLPTRIQNRLTRAAAYAEASKEVSRWTNVVARNRAADQLDFSTFERPAEAVSSSGALVGKFEPSTNLEMEIAGILAESSLTDKKQMELEDLEMNKISKEEVAARRAELAKLRSLAFFAEQKAKRIAKIKSKTFRKVHKKSEARKASKEAKEVSIDDLKDLDPEAAREKTEKIHADRIKERMTLKHKSTGKWARKMLSRSNNDPETRQALMNQLNKSQSLTRKIAGLDSDQDSEDLNSVDESGSDDGAAESRVRERGQAKLDDLEVEINAVDVVPTKGIYAMKFMQKSLLNQQNETKALLEQARRSILIDSDDDEDISSENESNQKRNTTNYSGVGRIAFGKVDRDDDHQSESDKGEDLADNGIITNNEFSMKSSHPISISLKGNDNVFEVSRENSATFVGKIGNAKFEDVSENSRKNFSMSKDSNTVDFARTVLQSKASISSKNAENDDESNSWLTITASATKKSTKATSATHSDKAMEKMNRIKQQKKIAEFSQDINGTLNLDGVRKLETAKQLSTFPLKPSVVAVVAETKAEKYSKRQQESKQPVKKKIKPAISYASDEDSDPEIQQERAIKNFVHATDIKDLTQRELMQIAFANDNVANEFDDEKADIAESDAPKTVDETLPGWRRQPMTESKQGSWAGSNLTPKMGVVTKIVKKSDSIDAHKRKDFKLKHVIINERRMKKATKYLTTELPFGYESRQQYEQALRMPLGIEWNSTGAHTKLTAPKVVTKMGTVIHPLKMRGFGPPVTKGKKSKN
ncbi:hypothetical protein HK100_005536 [Physocladia obscura]|uniref:U3 small nucleolar RNA-associated protein 14 n=1 Tax=Physocladia obscura TaxID=109957 RepID=A0AAD5STR7_9FUNG|nr:hypothetical protein HK100_005536 [Physocladia obscura]